MDGLEVCRRIRQDSPLPVIMLTARGDEEDRILGLEVADDYVRPPHYPKRHELALIIREFAPLEFFLRRGRRRAGRNCCAQVSRRARAGPQRGEREPGP
ncbi:hypothetical protein [Streptomyces sp. NPDC001275]